MTDTAFDSKRRLCPDGSCVGVIGSDGRCSVCGRNASGKPDMALVGAARADDTTADDTLAEDAREDEAHAVAAAGGSPAAGSGFDPSRRLCEDGSCVGVIGPDGRCSVCGQEATAKAKAE
jgi:hypothetical protein